jgi:hypothetical protein
MPGSYVGISDDAGDKLNVAADGSLVVSGTVSTIEAANPSLRGVYVFSQEDVPGVVAANNFVSLFNASGSGRILVFAGAFVSSTAAGGTTVTAPMRGYRVTTATGGTLQAASASGKFITTYPNPTGEVRLGSTVTLGAALFNSPPVISATVGSTPVHSVPVIAGAGLFTFAEGEGLVLRTTSGDVDQRWNFSIVWGEI